ncbi:MAG: V-type ATP synthase subunit D [Candidatus Woesearchaeota archaeon]|nr:V-type ATP synthase subunit D [Candidatus Woesearchaeota archaeon]MDP7323343.1 V-type ATP synthase subunit D [Candidatus Woesearchaeota archaeon]
MVLDIKPTRSELIKLNKSIKLAKSGHSLLKKKRDGMIMEFFEILKNAKSVRGNLAKTYVDAQKKINIARTLYTDLKLTSLAFAIHDNPEVKVKEKNIMGVKVPEIESKQVVKTLKERKLGVAGSTAMIDDAIASYEKLVDEIIKVAEVETTMKKLLSEIEKTKRRVNALEFSVIPSMEEMKAFIKLRLEEMERENIFRLKRVKAKAA